MNIAAIPTVYRGNQMRSRLEARWAAFFDLVGWRWEYEPFDLPGWIPDFHLRVEWSKLPILADVKPATGDHAPRDIAVKIEQAFGAPLPIEIRKTAKGAAGDKEWNAWFRTLEYSLLVIAMHPLRVGIDFARGERPNNDRYIGWSFVEDWGWWPLEIPLDCQTVETCLAAAANKVQWKAPA